MKAILIVSAMLALALPGNELLADSRDWSLTDIQGGTFKLSENLGKPTLLVFWATWCVPCKKEMSDRASLFDSYVEKGAQVLLISEDNLKSQAKVKPFIESKGYKWPVLLDPDGKILKRYGGTSSIPYTVLLDSKGEPALKIVGAIKDVDTLTRRIDKLLGAQE